MRSDVALRPVRRDRPADTAVTPWWQRSAACWVGCAAGTAVSVGALVATPARAPYPLAIWIPLQLVGAAFVAAGTVAWRRRPLHNAGRLLMASGIAWYFADLQLAANRWLFGLGFTFFYLVVAIFTHLILSLLTGRLAYRRDLVLVTLMYAAVVLPEGAWLVTVEGRPGAHMWGGPAYGSSWGTVGSVAAGGLTLWAILVVVHRCRHAPPPVRRSFAALWVAGATAGVVALAGVVASVLGAPLAVIRLILLLFALVMLALPFAALVGVVWARVSRLRVADLVLRLQAAPDPQQVREALVAALGDPSLQLCFHLDEGTGYVDTHGARVDLADTGSQAVTFIGHGGVPLAALVHDPALAEQQSLVDAVVAAARLALNNAYLLAAQQRQLAELRASRARIVAAADEERKRIQRDLHDGAQHTLLATSMLLGQALEEPAQRQNHLRAASAALQGVVKELRELTEGLDPPALTEQGLAAVVETLAERAPLPIVFEVPQRRWPSAVERTAFFVIKEALSNVYKHAHASTAWVRVSEENHMLSVAVHDDGVGHACFDQGSGLRGLRDRVATVEGTFDVHPRPAGGTTVEVQIPCGS